MTLSWLPQYFRDLGVELSNVGFYSVAPYLAMVLFENTWATLMDAQMNAGKLSLLNLRRLSQTVAFGCPAAVIAVMLGVGTSTPWVASAMLAAALASNMASHSGYWANMIVRSLLLCPSAPDEVGTGRLPVEHIASTRAQSLLSQTEADAMAA